MKLTHEYTYDIEHRFGYLVWIIAAVFLIFVARLYYLQVIKGSYYRFFSEQNSIKEISVPALRGMIFDRNGEIIVDNRPAFDAVLVPQYVKDKPKVIEGLADILKMNVTEVEAAIVKGKGQPSYFPVMIKSDISQDEMAVIKAYKTPSYDSEDLYDLRGVDVRMRYERTYNDPLFASHLLGYLREIDPDRLKGYEGEFPGVYKMGDYVGIRGVEEAYDYLIRGEDGYEQKIVNAFGREVDWEGIELIHKGPLNGASAVLTIDADLQRIAKDGLSERGGAVVALDPRDGSVLALYSAPSFDLNRLSSPEGDDYWREIVSDPRKVLYNRAIQGSYPPGSTFKVVTATAALGEGAIKPNNTVYCGGGLHFGNRFYQCWRDGGHGNISIVDAIAESCDTFFYQMGLRLGVDKIAKYAFELGLGKITGIDIPGEKSGTIPTSEWKQKTFNTPWQAGENLSIAVGQSYDTVTPLQNAVMMATVANNGKRVTPYVVKSIIDNEGIERYRHSEIGSAPSLELSREQIEIVKKGLEGAVNSVGGTAHALGALGLKIAGKTGTAQVISKEAWSGGVAEYKDHAWFVGYAPYDNPEIVVAALVEHGGFGASAAAPIVGNVMKKYFEKKDAK